VSRQTTDVDRALAAIGGPIVHYHTFGPRPLPQRNAELEKIFTYNDAGIGEYHPAPVEMSEEPVEDIAAPPLAGLPTASETPVPLPEPAMALTPPPVLPVRESSPAPAPASPLGDAWQDRSSTSAPTSAMSAEARSMAAMFNMLAGKAHVQPPREDASTAPTAPRDDGSDLFRRL
jgi:hypothetical protein